MKAFSFGKNLYATALMLLVGSAAHAATLYVNCGTRSGGGAFTSIGAALQVLKGPESRGPATINVSGACRENIVIQSLDRLTLNALNGASISDASGGKSDVIGIYDSRDVSINGFTINASSDGVSGANGIGCSDWSACRLALNVIQGAGSGAGLAVYQAAEATVDGDTFQSNHFGIIANSGTRVRPGGQFRPITSQQNGEGIHAGRQSLVIANATVQNNTGKGVNVLFNSTLELIGSISNNGDIGAHVHEGSNARFTGGTLIQGNGGPGVLIQDLSMVNFDATVTGNRGAYDVECDPQFSATRGVADTGGTTNCVEP